MANFCIVSVVALVLCALVCQTSAVVIETRVNMVTTLAKLCETGSYSGCTAFTIDNVKSACNGTYATQYEYTSIKTQGTCSTQYSNQCEGIIALIGGSYSSYYASITVQSTGNCTCKICSG